MGTHLRRLALFYHWEMNNENTMDCWRIACLTNGVFLHDLPIWRPGLLQAALLHDIPSHLPTSIYS